MMKKLLLFKQIFTLLLLTGNLGYVNAQCTFTGLNANYCTNSAASTLSPGIAGGTFSGPGVLGSVFTPSVAGPGTIAVNYQICSSTYSVTLGTYSPVASATAGTSESLGDDQLSGAISLPFNFKFFCNTYSSYYISSNGYITFNSAAGSGCCQGGFMPTGTTPDNMIAAAWVDLYPPSGGTITHTTVGTAPNRIHVIAYNGINHYNGSSANTCCPITTQIMLYETTNVIEIHTTSKPLPTTTSLTYSCTMGIQNSGATAAYAVTGRNASPTWTASNECYRWTPGASCNVTQTTVVSPSTISVVGNNSICIGATATLTASGNTTYTWSTSANTSSVSVTPSATQTYTVSGTNSFGCVANSAITVTVDNTPTVTATASSGSGVCPGATLTLNGGGASSYTWTGGVTTVTNGVPFTLPSSTPYTVTGVNACGSATAAITVSIHPLPNVTPSASSPSICSGGSLALTGVGNATNYAWKGSTPAFTVANTASFTPALTQTNYTVIGTSALSCTAAATITVPVISTPSIAPTSGPGLICIGKSSTLTATGASNYTWTGGAAVGNNSVYVVTPSSPGISTYTVIRANSTCTTSAIVSVVTNSLPNVFAITSSTLVCASTAASLAVAGGQSYTWTSPGAPPSVPAFTFGYNNPNPIVFPPVSSVYTVAASDGTCVNTTTVAVNTNPNPTITIATTATAICVGQSVTVSATGAINYTWTTGTNTYNTVSVTESPTVATAYNVTGDNSFGCTSTAGQVVLVNPNPTLNVAPVPNKTLVCNGGSSTLTVGGANTYTWSSGVYTGAGTSAVVTSTALSSGPVIYTVTGTNTLTGCTSSKTATINVFIPTLAVSGTPSTCPGGNITLSASGGNANSYTWTAPGSATSQVGFSSINTPISGPGVFTVSAMTTSLIVICPGTQTVAVNLYPNPVITASAQRTVICNKEHVTLTAGGGTAYAWSNGAQTSTISVGPTSNTTYTVTGTDNNGCVNTGTVLVKVSGCAGIGELTAANSGLLVYPNPNGGNFTIESNSDARLTLINELGQIVRTFVLSGSNNYNVAVSDLAKGVYFLSGEKDGFQINQKIIVTK